MFAEPCRGGGISGGGRSSILPGDPAYDAKSCMSEAICGQGHWPAQGPGIFWVFNGQIGFLPHSRDSFSLNFNI